MYKTSIIDLKSKMKPSDKAIRIDSVLSATPGLEIIKLSSLTLSWDIVKESISKSIYKKLAYKTN